MFTITPGSGASTTEAYWLNKLLKSILIIASGPGMDPTEADKSNTLNS
jgi:hypothetical protein